MQATSPIPKPTTGRTFYVAISFLGAVAIAQLLAVGWIFISRFHAPAPAELADAANRADAPIAKLNLADSFAAPTPAATPLALPKPTPVPVEIASLPKPTPVPLRKEPTPEARITELVEQAQALRDRGDTSTALTRLRESQAIGPDKPQIIAEMALTFEKLGLPDKALEQWHRIFDMGDSAGIYFAAADAKIKNSDAVATADQAKTELAKVEQVKKETSGLVPGATLTLGEITVAELSDPKSEKKFAVKIPIKSQPGANIQVPSDVVVQVFFYDVVDNQTVVRTSANVTSRWLTEPADWKEDDLEVLEVQYQQPKSDSKIKPIEDRKYFGYIVRVYFKNDLQDRKAEPANLLKQYPAPLTLTDENK